MRVIQDFDQLLRAIDPIVAQSLKTSSLILLGGCSKVGKTLLTEKIVEALSVKDIPSLHISLDAWLVDVRKRPPNSTVLERFDCKAIFAAIKNLLKGLEVFPPLYDPVTRFRIAENGKKSFKISSGLLLVEGVMALALESLRALSSFNIFVSAPNTLRLKRLQEFYKDYKELSQLADSIIEAREKEEVPFVLETKKWADLIFEERS